MECVFCGAQISRDVSMCLRCDEVWSLRYGDRHLTAQDRDDLQAVAEAEREWHPRYRGADIIIDDDGELD